MFNRLFKLPQSQSFFLFGARGTGKTTLLQSLFPIDQNLYIDLLDEDVKVKYEIRPMDLYYELEALKQTISWVVIDEVQRVPTLLNVIQKIMGKKKYRFCLTGSSARKLKRGAANLLAGRAIQHYLYPLTHLELGDDFRLHDVLRLGSLPEIFQLNTDVERQNYLRTYVNTYIKEEIVSEQIIRNLPPFRAFLELAAHGGGRIINYSKFARDVGSSPITIKSYFQILEDTLIGFQLQPFHYSVRKRQSQSPKFYFFDLGVQTALKRQTQLPIEERTWDFGERFEQWIIVELFRLNHYFNKDWVFSYLLTKDNVEIDLIIERPGLPNALVEIKSTNHVTEDDVKSIKKIAKDIPNSDVFCFSLDPTPKLIDSVRCLYWKEGFCEIGIVSSNELFTKL